MKIYTLKKGGIDRFLKRLKGKGASPALKLDEVLKEILAKANEFVPSEAGSILLDDPQKKFLSLGDPSSNRLHLVACFGPKSEQLLGLDTPVTRGVAGSTYLAGKPFMSTVTAQDEAALDGMDKALRGRVKSVLCVPIVIGRSVCGVIELLNRKGKSNYTINELKLLEIFAGYTSTLIQNALDANRNEELTRKDDLTGLYNDRYFHQLLTEELKKAKKTKHDISLAFLDLDNFKQVNDTYGHLAGSRTLSEVGALIKSALKNTAAVAVRYGGDEFAVVLPGMSKIEAYVIVERVRKAVEAEVFLKKRRRRGDQAHKIEGLITCSIGIASFFEDGIRGDGIEEEKTVFIRSADRAMYSAKESGKNRVSFCDGPPAVLISVAPVKDGSKKPGKGRPDLKLVRG